MSRLSQPGGFARRAWLSTLLLCSIIAFTGAKAGEGDQVGIDNFTFSPNLLTIAKGTEVTWTNHDDIPHSIVLPSLSVRSKAMDTDKTFSYRFEKAGTYTYLCGLHPHMQAKVVVTE